MTKYFIGAVIGISLSMAGTAFAAKSTPLINLIQAASITITNDVSKQPVGDMYKIVDGKTSCYVYVGRRNGDGSGISCI